MKIRFWPALLVILVIAVTTAAGFWQLSRAHQKEARQHQLVEFENAPPVTLGAGHPAPASIEYRRIRMRGHFLADRVVYLENRPYQDQPGFYVVMPFAVDGGGQVLVNRGWLPRNLAERTAIAPHSTPGGTIELEGVARATLGRTLALGGGGHERGEIRQNLSIPDYASETGLSLEPFAVEQISDTGDGLVRDWPRPAADVDRNYGYMGQWWCMAAATLVFGLYAARRAALAERTARVKQAEADSAMADKGKEDD